MQQDDAADALTQRFLRAFRDEMGTINCRELTGIDRRRPRV